MERKGLLKLPFQILIYEISKFLELKDYLNYTSTCKYLNNNKEKSDIWKRQLLNNYSEEDILFVKDEETSFNKYKKLKILTRDYHKCVVSHNKTHWIEKDNELMLVDVWWLQIFTKFNDVPDGKYIPEFKVKFAKRTLGLDLITFNARVLEIPIKNNDNDTQQNQPSQENDENQENKDENKEKSNNNKNNLVSTNNTINEIEKDNSKDSSKDIINVKVEENSKQIENTANKLNEEKDKNESTNNNLIIEEKQVNTTKTPSIELDSSNLFYCINGILPNNDVNIDLIYGPPKIDDENAYIDVTEPDRIIPINGIITKKRKFVDDAGWNKYGYELYDEADYEQAKTLPHSQRYDNTSLISPLFFVTSTKRQKEKKEKREKAVFDPTLHKPSEELLTQLPPWSPEEKEILNEAIQTFGHNWRLVSEYMQSKNVGQRYMYECFDKGHLIDENEVNNLNAAEQRKNMKELKKLMKISEKKRQARHFEVFDRMKELLKKKENKPIRTQSKRPSLQAHETHLQSQTKAGVDIKQLLNPIELSDFKYKMDTEAKKSIRISTIFGI